jgi:hypothetical protein
MPRENSGLSATSVTLSPPESIQLGVSAGVIEVCLLQPMLYCKNATQQRLPFTLDPRVLYRGIGMSVINMGILTGVQFPITGAAAGVITGGVSRRLSDNEKVAAGFIGGAVSGVICAPMELIMIQQQRHGGSLVHQGGRIVSEFGASGLFRGLITSCGREGLFTAGYLGIGPVFAEKLRRRAAFLALCLLPHATRLRRAVWRAQRLPRAAEEGERLHRRVVRRRDRRHPLPPARHDQDVHAGRPGAGPRTAERSRGPRASRVAPPAASATRSVAVSAGQVWLARRDRAHAAAGGGRGALLQRLELARLPHARTLAASARPVLPCAPDRRCTEPRLCRRTGRMILAIFIIGQCKDVLSPVFFPHHFSKKE